MNWTIHCSKNASRLAMINGDNYRSVKHYTRTFKICNVCTTVLHTVICFILDTGGSGLCGSSCCMKLNRIGSWHSHFMENAKLETFLHVLICSRARKNIPSYPGTFNLALRSFPELCDVNHIVIDILLRKRTHSTNCWKEWPGPVWSGPGEDEPISSTE